MLTLFNSISVCLEERGGGWCICVCARLSGGSGVGSKWEECVAVCLSVSACNLLVRVCVCMCVCKEINQLHYINLPQAIKLRIIFIQQKLTYTLPKSQAVMSHDTAV